MWSSNTFGDSTTGGFLNSTNATDSPQTKGKSRRIQSLVPVCIRQLRDHKEEEFKLFGLPTNMLTIVGILREYEVQSTKATYTIEDHTGTIKAVWWLEADSNSDPNLPSVKEGSYVRVYGSLRIKEDEKFIMVLRMFSVEDINEITTHLLEVIHTRLEAEAASKGPSVLEKIKKNNPGAALANSMSFMETDSDYGTTSNGFTRIQEKVFRILQSATHQCGIHRSEIMKQFPANQSREVDNALEFLTNEGHAYSTIDNDHFKVTDSM